MPFPSQLGQPLAKVAGETLRVALVLKAAHEIIRIAGDDRVASGNPLAPCVVAPFIEHVVQVHVGKARRDYPALRSALAPVRPAGPFHSTGVPPLDDRPDDPLVPDSSPEHPDQMVPLEIAEKPADIGVNNPVDLPPFHSDRHGVERIVRPAPRSEPVAETEEHRLVVRHQNRVRHRPLENLILQRGNAEVPLFAGFIARMAGTAGRFEDLPSPGGLLRRVPWVFDPAEPLLASPKRLGGCCVQPDRLCRHAGFAMFRGSMARPTPAARQYFAWRTGQDHPGQHLRPRPCWTP